MAIILANGIKATDEFLALMKAEGVPVLEQPDPDYGWEEGIFTDASYHYEL